jgi:uncharacterized protein (TIGR02246 family)
MSSTPEEDIRREHEAEVRAVITAYQAAIRAGDLDGMLAHHGEQVVMFDVAPPLQRKGLAACREAWEPFVHGGPHEHFELGELTLRVDDELAFAHALLRLKEGGPFEVRVTLALEKLEGRWTIVHEHHSAPSDA